MKIEKKKVLIEIFIAVFFFILLSLVFAISTELKEKSFETDSAIIKFSIKQGDSIDKTLKITNLAPQEQNFVIKTDLELLSFDVGEFSLKAGESYSAELFFKGDEKEGVYVGNLIIEGSSDSIKIPVILEVESREVLFDVNLNIPPQYTNGYPGEKVVVEVKIFDLENIGLKTLETNYLIKDFEGKEIFSEQENLAVENQVSTTKMIPIPEDTKPGNYVFIASAKYGNSVGTGSYFFRIVKKEESSFIEKNLVYLVFVFLAVILAVVVLVIYSIIQKDRILLELEKQHKRELKKELEKLEKERGKIKELGVRKRKKELKKFREKRNKRVGAIKIIYRTRVKILKKLKKQKKKSEMQKKLEDWKKQGYNINEFLVKRSKKESLKKSVEKLKKEGYKV